MYRDVSLMEGTIIHWRLEITWVLSILVKLCKNCKVRVNGRKEPNPFDPQRRRPLHLSVKPTPRAVRRVRTYQQRLAGKGKRRD